MSNHDLAVALLYAKQNPNTGSQGGGGGGTTSLTLLFPRESWSLSRKYHPALPDPDIIDPVEIDEDEDNEGDITRYADARLSGVVGSGTSADPWSLDKVKQQCETALSGLYIDTGNAALVVLEIINPTGVKWRNQIAFAWEPVGWLEIRTKKGDPKIWFSAKNVGTVVADGVYNGLTHYKIAAATTFANISPGGSQPETLKNPQQVWIDGWQLRSDRTTTTFATNLANMRTRSLGGAFVQDPSTGDIYFVPYTGNWVRYEQHYADAAFRKKVNQTESSLANFNAKHVVEYNARSYIINLSSSDGNDGRRQRNLRFRRIGFEGSACPSQGFAVNLGGGCEALYCEFKDSSWGGLKLGTNTGTFAFPFLHRGLDTGGKTQYGGLVLGCHFHDNGVIDLVTTRVFGVTVTRNLFEFSGWQNADHNWEGGCTKFNQSSVVFDNNTCRFFRGKGAWFDYECRGSQATANRIHDGSIDGVSWEMNTNFEPGIVSFNLVYHCGQTRTEGNLGSGILTNLGRAFVFGNVLVRNRGGFLRGEDSRSTSGIDGKNGRGSMFVNNWIIMPDSATGYAKNGTNASQDGRGYKDDGQALTVDDYGNPNGETGNAYTAANDPLYYSGGNTYGRPRATPGVYKRRGVSSYNNLAAIITAQGSTNFEVSSREVWNDGPEATAVCEFWNIPNYDMRTDVKQYQCQPYYLDTIPLTA